MKIIVKKIVITKNYFAICIAGKASRYIDASMNRATNGHFRQMVNLAIIFKSLTNGYNYGTIFKIHVCINCNYIEYIIMIA